MMNLVLPLVAVSTPLAKLSAKAATAGFVLSQLDSMRISAACAPDATASDVATTRPSCLRDIRASHHELFVFQDSLSSQSEIDKPRKPGERCNRRRHAESNNNILRQIRVSMRLAATRAMDP